MPKLNTNVKEVRDYFLDICENWVEKYKIDGIRLDVANEISHTFSKELHTRLKERNPDLYILGEIWHDAFPWLRGDEFDGVMNYPLGESIKDFWVDESLTKNDFEYTINRCYTRYMQQTNDVLFNLLDSHDTIRLMNHSRNLDEFYQQLAVLFTMPGSPCIYYGTEIAMEGGYDPDCRRCMPWSAIEAGEFQDRIDIMKNLIEIRKKESLMRTRNFHFTNNYKNPRVIEFQKVGWIDNFIEIIINVDKETLEVEKSGNILFSRYYSETVTKEGIKKCLLEKNGILIRRGINK
jgi:glycosidase